MLKNTIKNINLYQTNHKFNKNISLLKSDIYKINIIPIDCGINKYIFTNHINENSIFIFNSSIINEEIKQFINLFHERLSIYILIDSNFNKAEINNVKYLKLPNYLVNLKFYQKSLLDKNNQMVYFHNIYNEDIPNNLKSLLYPNSNFIIKLFDCPNIKHPLNLGYLEEEDKSDILYESKYYLHLKNDDMYLAEALLAGCMCLDIESEIDIKNQINNYSNQKYEEIINNIIGYDEFLKGLIL